jgi:cell division septation protein DedD
VAALVVLGAISGLTLAVYWVWAGPLITERVELPAVRRPPVRLAEPLPAVQKPAIESVGDEIALPHLPEPEEEQESHAGPPRAVATEPLVSVQEPQSVWVVRVGAFADDGRASSLVSQLEARRFTAFASAETTRQGTPLRVVLVGPYASRSAALRALDRIEEMPGLGRPVLQAVPPATALR